MSFYNTDLAYIHDAGFRDYCHNAAPGIRSIFARHGVKRGLVVDLGCGSGRWAHELNRAGFDCLGIDRSPAMLELAARNAPDAEFRLGSVFDPELELPACIAVTALGEVLSYGPPELDHDQPLADLLKRVYRALIPGGVLVFDIATPARAPRSGTRLHWHAGSDWAISSATTAGPGKLLRREITCFRQTGELYRRSQEVHTLHLAEPADVVARLGEAGFRSEVHDAYGSFRLPLGVAAIVASKDRGD